MRSDLIITRIPMHDPAWYEFRKNGIGGSDISTILGLNKYETAVRLFHEKVGTIEPNKEDNEAMHWGKELEDTIADNWRYYDGTQYGYIQNKKEGKIVRECRSINGYVVNPKYPWLFASIDKLINIKGGVNLITAEPLKTEGILECKEIGYNMWKVWEEGIPPYFFPQISQYMLILETDYAEIAILKNGRNFIVEKVAQYEPLAERIINVSKAFWYNRVMPAKEAHQKKIEAEKSGNIREIEKWEGEIQRYEPEPDNTEAYTSFMNERFLKQRESIDGNIDMYDLCKRDKVLNGIKGIIDDERTGIKNKLIKELTLESAEIIDFGKMGTVDWSERKGTKSRTFNNRIREKPSEEVLMKEFLKLNLDCY